MSPYRSRGIVKSIECEAKDGISYGFYSPDMFHRESVVNPITPLTVDVRSWTPYEIYLTNDIIIYQPYDDKINMFYYILNFTNLHQEHYPDHCLREGGHVNVNKSTINKIGVLLLLWIKLIKVKLCKSNSYCIAIRF